MNKEWRNSVSGWSVSGISYVNSAYYLSIMIHDAFSRLMVHLQLTKFIWQIYEILIFYKFIKNNMKYTNGSLYKYLDVSLKKLPLKNSANINATRCNLSVILKPFPQFLMIKCISSDGIFGVIPNWFTAGKMKGMKQKIKDLVGFPQKLLYFRGLVSLVERSDSH